MVCGQSAENLAERIGARDNAFNESANTEELFMDYKRRREQRRPKPREIEKI